ncbi:hypothetical protein [Streptobacillus moniliformis]|uniref:hypothetical protein n=1 Tax=Streptobacillus moniliformis TaxID=34105 RepID=UPI00068D6213|nr:hypothetical protein [Streptobacillus moniliformis]SQA13628.1 Uncharacterised protein [Streptobacillus moniliformis]
MSIITEEMKFRHRLCEYAIKNGVTKAARRYHTNRQFVYRQLKKYNGNIKSLALGSRKPHTSPNAHTEEELILIKNRLYLGGNNEKNNYNWNVRVYRLSHYSFLFFLWL